MLRAVSLSGKWMLRPYDRKKTENFTSWFIDHDALEIDMQNSVQTSLMSAGIFEDGGRGPIDALWCVERRVLWEPEPDLRVILKLPDARKIQVNGVDIEGPDITDLLVTGRNVISAVVPGWFSGDMAYCYTSTKGVIHSCHFWTKPGNGGYDVRIAVDYISFREHRSAFSVEILGEKLETELSFGVGRETHELEMHIPGDKVEVWNVNGDGKQSVHRARIRIDDAELERKLSFRDMEIRDGKLFVNGEKFFAKGAVWPAGRIQDRDRIFALLSAAKEANMNVLYIPRGHEENYFYNECDSKGLIVIHGEDAPSLSYHPSFISGDVRYDIFRCFSHDANYFEHILDVVALERFMLKTRASNHSDGIIYDNLLSTLTPEGGWKPGHFCTRRFFADLVPIMTVEDGKLVCSISNDSERDEEVEISIKVMGYDGRKKGKSVFRVEAPARTAVKFWEYDMADVDMKNEFMLMKMKTFDIHRELTLLLDNISSCGFELPEYQTSVRTISPTQFSIRVKVSKPAFAIHFNMRGVEGRFSDSFFEARPTSEKSVVFKASREMTEEEVLERLEIYDLAHALREAGESEEE